MVKFKSESKHVILIITATFISVETRCNPNKENTVLNKNGYISSTVLDTNGCGSNRSPWRISANPGQTIELELIDFSVKSHQYSLMSCRNIYGFIIERSLGINHTICGGNTRQMSLYQSKTNSIEVYIRPKTVRQGASFLIKYSSKRIFIIADCLQRYFQQ